MFSRDIHETRKSRTRTDEDCREAFIIKEVINSHCPAGNDVGLDPDSKGLYRIDFSSNDLVLR